MIEITNRKAIVTSRFFLASLTRLPPLPRILYYIVRYVDERTKKTEKEETGERRRRREERKKARKGEREATIESGEITRRDGTRGNSCSKKRKENIRFVSSIPLALPPIS